MNIITIDFESFYDKDFSLSKITTEEYIRSPLFEAIGVSTKVNDGEIVWVSGDYKKIKAHLLSLPWNDHLLLAQNTAFDAAILNWRFGIKPVGYLDTMSMANAIHGLTESSSLANLAKFYGEADKGEQVKQYIGYRRKDFSPLELADYGTYCNHDVQLCYNIFNKMLPNFPKGELRVVDLTIRMFAEPQLLLDEKMLVDDLMAIRAEKRGSLLTLMNMLGVKNEDALKTQLMSNDKFAELLRLRGVEPPTKVSEKTKKEAWAFAKTDEEFTDLMDSEDPLVATMVTTRLAAKSTIGEKRTEAFTNIANRGAYPFSLKYSGAMITHRWSGFDTNPQNLPRGSTLRKSIMAPAGHQLVVADLSNIELRLGMWLAGQHDAIQQINDGMDLYRVFASEAFNIDYDKIAKDSDFRFIAKVCCIAEGELVLTPRGLIPIEKITLDDTVWDGVDWVSHTGVVYMGEREVITYDGLTATEDHKIWTEDGRYICFGEAASRLDRLATTGHGGQALRFMADTERSNNTQGQAPLCERIMSVRKTTSSIVRKFNSWGEQSMSFMRHENMASSAGAFNGSIRSTSQTTEASQCNVSTVQQSQRQSLRKLRGARDTVSVWVSSGMRKICDVTTGLAGGYNALRTRPRGQQQSLHGREHKVCNSLTANEKPKKVTPVYDITNAGSRHRFTVSGKLVSNCLSLIYGTGSIKLRETIRIQSKGKTVVSAIEAERLKSLYREKNTNVVDAWGEGGQVLEWIRDNESHTVYGFLPVLGDTGIIKPNGLSLPYPKLTVEQGIRGEEWYYEVRRGRATMRDKVYGAKVFQRTTQSLARDIMAEHTININKRYTVAGLVHDEVICIVPDDEVEVAKAFITQVMRTPPSWAKDLPLNCDVGSGKRYGNAK